MKLHKQLTALFLAMTLVLATAGCAPKDTTWAAKSGDDSVKTGVYILEMMMGYNEAQNKAPEAKDLLKETIDGKPAPQYITDYAKGEVANLLGIRAEFAKRGLTLSEDDTKQATEYTEYLYSSGTDYYSANGVSKESVQYLNETTMMSLAVFQNIYGEGGEKAVPAADLKKAFGEKYTRSQYLLFPKVDTTSGAALPEDKIAAAKTLAADYLKRAQAGESFTDLIYQLEDTRRAEGAQKNEKMEEKMYDVYLANNAGYFPPAYEAGILTAADNSITQLEDEYYIYIIRKLPVLEGDAESMKQYLDAVLQEMKYDEYIEGTKAWGAALTPQYNTQTLSQYTPAKLKMTEEQLASSSSTSASGSSESGASTSASSESGASTSASPSSASTSVSASPSSAS